jgi:D-alanyl-D-alanine carboxypeptidase (penicillin-binding protein 5/6)
MRFDFRWRLWATSVCLLITSGVIPVSASTAEAAAAPPPPQLDAASYILVSAPTGTVLAAANPDKRIKPASMTKMMTAYVVFTALQRGAIHLDDQVPISAKAWRMGGSKMFVKVGNRVPLHDLLSGMLVDSGNDAAVALAEYVGGDEATFVQSMNLAAEKLGMSRTHFANVTGLPHADHYTTARDLSFLALTILREYPQYLHFFSAKSFTWAGIKQYSWTKLMFHDPSVDGLKTGYTDAAGYCITATAKRGDLRLVAVVTHTRSIGAENQSAEALLNYGFRYFRGKRVAGAEQALIEAQVWEGQTDKLPLGVTHPVYVTLEAGQLDQLEVQMQYHKPIVAPVKRGTVLGEITVKLNQQVLQKKPLVALTDVLEGSWWHRLADAVLLHMPQI